jgi:hypothetical protein
MNKKKDNNININAIRTQSNFPKITLLSMKNFQTDKKCYFPKYPEKSLKSIYKILNIL